MMKILICREEIQRIKAEKPNIPHREAFSMAAKNVRYACTSYIKHWTIYSTQTITVSLVSSLMFFSMYFDQWAKCDPRASTAASSSVKERPVKLLINSSCRNTCCIYDDVQDDS